MNRYSQASCCLFITVIALNANNIGAQDSSSEKSGDSATFNIEGKLEFEFSSEYDANVHENVYKLEPTLELEFEYKDRKNIKLGGNLEYGREVKGGNKGRETKYTTSFTVNELFLKLSEPTKKNSILNDMSMTLGRKNLSDAREWFYDAEVDGVIFELSSSALNTDLTFSYNREEWIGSDLLRHNETDTVSNIIIALEHQPLKRIDFGAYAIIRRDESTDNDSPQIIGLSARGKLLDKRLNFWSDFAVVNGVDGDERIDGKGFDLGATMKFAGIGKPYVTLAYAYGSGDGDEDTDFRQSGLHANSDKFGGVTNFKYYGELVDPELSNLNILTAGIGFRPKKKVSVDLIYHHYEQDVALDELRDSSLNEDPNGLDTDIGSEWDLVAGFTSHKNFQTELILGYFQPGAAFDDRREVLLFNAKFTYEF